MAAIQFTVTVNEGKWLIAHAVAGMPEVRSAMARGRVVFKAGTTVSCISQLMIGEPLRIYGRITARGTVSSKEASSAAHCLMYDQGKLEMLDDNADETFFQLGPGDVMIIGANLIDIYGNAAMLAGGVGGGFCGRAISALTTQGFRVIVPVGLEKLSPVPVSEALRKASRQGIDRARGMACGLIPIFGQIVTEIEAIRLIADVDVCLIARGGVYGAEGGSVFQARGPDEEIKALEAVLEKCRQQPVGGESVSLIECSYPSVGCGNHLSCCYKAAGLQKRGHTDS